MASLMLFPAEIYNINLRIKMCLVETKIEYESYVNYFDYHCYGERWTKGILKTDDIMNLDTMTFTLKVDIVDIFDTEGNNLDAYVCIQFVKTVRIMHWKMIIMI